MADDYTGTVASNEISEARQNWLKTQAMNAYYDKYGTTPDVQAAGAEAQAKTAQVPYAGPQAAATVAKTQADVGDVQSQTAQRQQLVQRNNLFTIAKMMQKPDGSVDTSLLDNPAVLQFGGIDAPTAAQLKQTLAGPDGAARLQQFLSAGVGPAGSLAAGSVAYGQGPDGTTVMIGHTKAGAPIVQPLNGVTPTQVENANTGQGRLALQQTIQPQRVAIAQQNANTQAYSAGTRANNTEFGAAPGTALPAQRGAAPQDAGAQVDKIHGNPSPTAYIESLPPKGRMAAVAGAQSVVNANTMLANTNTLIAQADKQIGAFTTGPGGELAHLPGSAATDLAHNLDTVKANVAQAVITSMKGANGSTGVGRILQSEYANFQKVLGAVDPTQSAGAVRFHLGLVRQSLNRMNQVLNDTYKAQWKTDPYTALGEKPPGSGAPQASPQDIVNELRRRGVVK
jgi:hypothetical protein